MEDTKGNLYPSRSVEGRGCFCCFNGLPFAAIPRKSLVKRLLPLFLSACRRESNKSNPVPQMRPQMVPVSAANLVYSIIMNRQDLQKKVSTTIRSLVAKKGYCSFVDLFMGLGYLSPQKLEDWRRRRIFCLERAITVNLARINFIMKTTRRLCLSMGLEPRVTGYRSWGKGRKVSLRFSKSGNPHIEALYVTHFVSPRVIQEAQRKRKKPIVFAETS
jgi:hypothetical protein